MHLSVVPRRAPQLEAKDLDIAVFEGAIVELVSETQGLRLDRRDVTAGILTGYLACACSLVGAKGGLECSPATLLASGTWVG